MALRVLKMKPFKEMLWVLLLLPYSSILLADIAAIHDEYKSWQSGNSVATNYQLMPVAHNVQREHVQSNPWKKRSFSYGGAKNNQLRPWGNVPQTRARSARGMRYFDEKFKQSSHQFDADYARELSSPNYSGYPGMGGMNHRYGGYPYGVYPPNGYYRNNTGLFGLMNNFMPW